ncbi:MAG: choice-of-anchor D domain-containing protein, partial [Candidatus Hydrogenedentes bacterium]|nr:choice-of-anchor D domain-containing protein [Candidatus Hydrogenedentota bacterium]
FTHEGGKYTWYLDQPGAVPDNWSVVIARQSFVKSFGGKLPNLQADNTTKRPGSPGVQSFHALYPGAPWMPVSSTYMDSYWRDSEPAAGKMMIIRGNWRAEFWAKGKNIGDQMRVRFYREGEATFIDRIINLTTQWQHYELDAFVPDDTDSLGPYGPAEYRPLLTLNFYAITPGGGLWLDDASLHCTDSTNPTAFTDTFVDRLKELKPGILRDWRVQFGASLDNELAEEFARKVTGWRPHERRANTWGYSLPDLLNLCREIGAEPWYSIPPTFTGAEFIDLCAYLCAPVSSGHPYALKRAAQGQNEPWVNVFPTIHLEFGNELWGAASGLDPFFGGSVLGGERLGKIAGDRFFIFRTGPYYDASKFNLIIGGQNGFPNRQGEIMDNSSSHDDIAIAPYFGTLDSWDSDEEIYYPLFARALAIGATKAAQSKAIIDGFGRGTKMSIYEINYHTTGGPAPASHRNPFVAGAGGALALPLYMLNFQRDLGVNNQCAFTASQYSFGYEKNKYVRLWGLLRDIEGTKRKRGTWLGLEMVNKGIFGNMVETTHSGALPTQTVGAVNGLSAVTTFQVVNSFAYHDGYEHSTVLFNLDLDSPHAVRLDHAQTPQQIAKMYQFAPANINHTNEDAQMLDYSTTTLNDFSASYPMTLPPRSLTVLTWSTKMGLTPLPTTLQFPDTLINTVSTQALTVQNEATTIGARNVVGISPLSGDTGSFQLLSAVPSASIAPGGSTQLQFQFSPFANGQKSASYLVATNDPDFPSFTITLAGKGTGDEDGDGVPIPTDLFPTNPYDWADTDGDGMGDNFEMLIINAAQTDGNPGNDFIQTFDDVLGLDDFDGDGYTNAEEFMYLTDPTDGTTSLPVQTLALVAALLGVGALAMRSQKGRLARQRVRK